MTIGAVLIGLAIIELILGLYFIFRYEKRQSTIWYGLFCMGVAVYVGANGLGYTGKIISGNTAEHFSWVGGLIATTFFLPFSFSFPVSRKKISELLPQVVWPLVVFLPGLLFTDVFIVHRFIQNFSKGYSVVEGQYLWLFLLFFAMYWIWAITNLLRSYQISDGIQKKHIRVLLFGLLISLAASWIFDIYISLVSDTSLGYLGSLLTSAWLGVTAWIIRKS